MNPITLIATNPIIIIIILYPVIINVRDMGQLFCYDITPPGLMDMKTVGFSSTFEVFIKMIQTGLVVLLTPKPIVTNVVVDSNRLFEKCMKQTSKNVIKGSDILIYCQSAFAFYCNHFVDDSRKDSPRKDMLLLAKKGVLHEDEIIYEEKYTVLRKLGVKHEDEISEEYRKLLPTNFKQIQIPTMRAKFKVCLDEMIHKKTRILYNAPLFFLPESILGKPDILEKRERRLSFWFTLLCSKRDKICKNYSKTPHTSSCIL